MERKGCILILSHMASTRIQELEWLNDIPPSLDYVIVKGNPELDSDCIHDIDTHTCILKVDDSYDKLALKMKRAYEFIINTFNPTFLIKIDDDVIVNVYKLLKVIKTLQVYDYCGIITYYNRTLYCGGPVYYMSNRALHYTKYIDEKDIQLFGFMEDACLGKTLFKHSVNSYCFHFYTNDISKYPYFAAYHDVKRIVVSGKTSTSQPAPAPARTKKLFGFLKI